jgi:hypothetical protein
MKTQPKTEQMKNAVDDIMPLKQEAGQGEFGTPPDELLDLKFLFSEIVSKWWLVLVCLLVGGYVGLGNLHNYSGVYVARMTVAPIGVRSTAKSQGIGLVSALAGLDIKGTAEVTKFDRLVFTTSTITFARILEEKYGLMKRFYGSNYDEATGSLNKPQGFEFETREKINRYLNLPMWQAPTIENLANFVASSFEVTETKDDLFKVLSFRHENPEEALELLNLIYHEAENLVKNDDKLEQQKRSKFLEERYADTKVNDFKQALVDMMAEQARQEMMSHADLSSVARIVEPPFVSKYKTTPNILSVLLVPVFGGLAVAIGFIILIALVRRE